MARVTFDYYDPDVVFDLEYNLVAHDNTGTILAFTDVQKIGGVQIDRNYVLTALHLPKKNHFRTAFESLRAGTTVAMASWKNAEIAEAQVGLRAGPRYSAPAAVLGLAAPELLKFASSDFLLHHDEYARHHAEKKDYAYCDETGMPVFKGPVKWPR